MVTMSSSMRGHLQLVVGNWQLAILHRLRSVRAQEHPMTQFSPQAVQDVYTRITAELGKVMVGQETIIRLLLVSLFARGHCLLVGVPGLAKTLLVRSLA